MAHYIDPQKQGYSRATHFTNEDSAIDKTGGRVSLIDGDVFYSPNSTRSIAHRPSRSPYPSRDIATLQDPVWWSQKYAHLAFIPTREFGSHPLDSLIHMPTQFAQTRKGAWLDPSYILSWNRLQFDLRNIIKTLADRWGIPPFPNVIDSALIGPGPHESVRVLREKVMQTRGLFLYWVGQLAFILALNISIDSNPPRPTYELPGEDTVGFDWEALRKNALPKWFKYLGERSWPQTLLSAVQSCVADFTHHGRVGLFVKLVNPDVDQYSLDWFLQFNVPIWYPWGKAESEAASRMRSVSQFAPLAYQLQEMGTILHKEPGVATHSSAGSESIDRHPWVAFLANREVLNAKILIWEKEGDKRKRIQRERQPPTANAKVFEWLEDDHGIFQRTAVAKVERTDVLSNYGRNQKRYNAFLNEWDCIADLGDMEEDELARMCWDEESILHEVQSSPSQLSPSNVSGGQSENYEPLPSKFKKKFSCQLVTEDKLPEAPQKISEVSSTLFEHFGFVPPLQSSSKPSKAVGNDEGFKLGKILGLTYVDEKYWASSGSFFAKEFLRSLESNVRMPDAEFWDLGVGNRLSLGSSRRLKFLRRFGSLFVFDFGASATCKWILAVEKASIALWLCRLDNRLDERELSLELSRHGIPHRTLIPLPASSIRMPPCLPLPVRLEGYVFTKSDYTSYVSATRSLLRSRRVARVALMAGGIAWRLAVEEGFDLVYDGPTHGLSRTGAGVQYATEDPRWEYWDDDCTAREMDQICGAYICYHGVIYFFIFIFVLICC